MTWIACIPSATASPRSPTVRSSPRARWRRCSLRSILGSKPISTGNAGGSRGRLGRRGPWGRQGPHREGRGAMETRANYVLIGAFTLAVVAAAFGFVYWFSNLGDHGVRDSYRVAFDGAVSGLRTGSTVLFNGIRVGEVTQLKLNPTNPPPGVATDAVRAKASVPAGSNLKPGFPGP